MTDVLTYMYTDSSKPGLLMVECKGEFGLGFQHQNFVLFHPEPPPPSVSMAPPKGEKLLACRLKGTTKGREFSAELSLQDSRGVSVPAPLGKTVLLTDWTDYFGYVGKVVFEYHKDTGATTTSTWILRRAYVLWVKTSCPVRSSSEINGKRQQKMEVAPGTGEDLLEGQMRDAPHERWECQGQAWLKVFSRAVDLSLWPLS